MDYFDLSIKKGGLSNIFKNSDIKFCFFSFTSDWLFQRQKLKQL